jgi:plasmid maintenance system antidote protein VapI
MSDMPRKIAHRKKKLSVQLAEAILSCGQTRYQIAKATGITEATLSKFVNGHHGLSQETVDVLGEYLGLCLVVDETKSTKKGK